MNNLNEIVSKNICEYRKACNLTQNELAQKLNFSDKSISKWERGESLPDLSVLVNMCEIFGITLNDIICEKIKKPKQKLFNFRNKFVVSLLSSGLVWLVATIVFVLLSIFSDIDRLWLSFIYAVPASLIVFVVFSCLWAPKWVKFTFISSLIWTSIVSICLTFGSYLWELLYIAIPLQILICLWFMLKKPKKNNP